MILLNQMVVLFLIMGVGFFCKNNGLLDEASVKKISGLVVNIANPAMVLSSAVSDHAGADKMMLLYVAGLAIIVYAILIVIAIFVPRILGVKGPDKGVYRIMTIFSNIGFMGFPVIKAAYGSEALLYASIFLFPYNILIYTYAIQELTGESFVKGGIKWKKIFNVGVNAGILAIILYIIEPPIPDFITQTVSSLSNLTAPLSMMVIGYSLAGMNIKELFTDVRLLAFSGIKLVLLPLVMIPLLRFAGISDILLGVCLIMFATPVGSMTAMMASQYGKSEELVSKGVALTTILSVITIPALGLVLGV